MVARMKPKAPKASKNGEIEIAELEQGEVPFYVLGRTPLVYNAVSFKAQTALLKPRTKTAAEKRTTAKHDPLAEYRDSVYRRRDDEKGPTRLLVPCKFFKAAMVEVCKRIPNAPFSTEIGQLVTVNGIYADLYGVPEIYMAVVRQAGMTKAPDIRTRAIVPEWCCKLSITYTKPLLSHTKVARLLGHAGILNGVGDERQQKGKNNFGQFTLVEGDNKAFTEIMKRGQKLQDQALASPVCYDRETEALLTWYTEAVEADGADDDVDDTDTTDAPELVDQWA